MNPKFEHYMLTPDQFRRLIERDIRNREQAKEKARLAKEVAKKAAR